MLFDSRKQRRIGAGVALVLAMALFMSGCGGEDAPSSEGPRFIVAGATGLAEMAGSEQRVLLAYDDASYIFDPDIAPDRKRLAFVRQAPAKTDANGEVDFGSDIYVSDIDGSRPRRVLAHTRVGEFIRNPTWLDNNELLVNVRGRARDGLPDLRIERLDLGTGARQRLIENAVEIALSPDRKRIAYVYVHPETRHEQLTIANLDGTNPVHLTSDTSPLVFISSLVWSPDGSTIGFTSADPSTGARAAGPAGALAHPTLQDIWLVQTDGSNLHRLVELAESQPSIAWSSDGKHLYAVGLAGFWRIDPTSGAMETIGPGISFGQIRLLSD